MNLLGTLKLSLESLEDLRNLVMEANPHWANKPHEYVVIELRSSIYQLEKRVSDSQERGEAYDLIDRQLRNSLDDDDYATFSSALDLIYAHIPTAVPEALEMFAKESIQTLRRTKDLHTSESVLHNMTLDECKKLALMIAKQYSNQ